MSALANKVEAHFTTKQARRIVMEEWDGLEIFVFPLTIVELKAIQKEEHPAMQAARIVQVRAKDSDGRRLFDENDFIALTTRGIGKYGPVAIADLARQIMTDLPSQEDVEKN